MTDMCNAVAMRLGSAGASLATPSKSAMGLVWTAPGWQGLLHVLQHWPVQPCVRLFDAVHMAAGHMPSADQVPIKLAHLTMLRPKWVVLIAGSTALHYVPFALPTFTSRRLSGAI
jgi:hypothetical protein